MNNRYRARILLRELMLLHEEVPVQTVYELALAQGLSAHSKFWQRVKDGLELTAKKVGDRWYWCRPPSFVERHAPPVRVKKAPQPMFAPQPKCETPEATRDTLVWDSLNHRHRTIESFLEER